jgi:RNA polymerase sigma-32 factor
MPRLATESARRYLANQPYLTREEEADLLAAWIERRCRKSRERLITGYAWLADQLARKYGSSMRGFELDDLMQEAMLALGRALDAFDASYGVRLGTYASFVIRQRMAAYAKRNRSIVATPQDVRDERGRPRSVDVELDAQFRTPEGRGGSLVDELEDESPGAHETLEAQDDRDVAHRLVWAAVERLPERERDVYVRRTLADPPETLKMLADRYGLSRERVRQIELAASEKVARWVRLAARGVLS